MTRRSLTRTPRARCRTRTWRTWQTCTRPAHLLAAGPLLGEPGRAFRGLSILAADPDQARVLKEQDPAVRAGVFRVECLPWLIPAGAVTFARTRFPRSMAEAAGD